MPSSDGASGMAGGRGTALLVIDMQNAFFEDDKLAGVRRSLIDACNGLSVEYRQAVVAQAVAEALLA
ncbi:hypothetical protein [Arthrobacter sp. B0490]|uniref:hypothetical protein n=1 Tax=Arthrobacter sp. B0490 TaxID=2058891 RepID=UPI0011B0648C|nr:hypothetical protein [Arthrobacter sp. B0490]